MSEVQDEGLEMPSTVGAEMQAIVREAACPVPPGEHIKAAINRSARRLGLGYRRTKAFWYQEARLISAEEADQLRAARQALRRERLVRLDAEADLLRAQIAERSL